MGQTKKKVFNAHYGTFILYGEKNPERVVKGLEKMTHSPPLSA